MGGSLIIMRTPFGETMTVMEVQKIPEVTVRDFRTGDESIFFELLENSFGSLEYLPRVKAEITGPYFNREGSFIAEKNGSPIGCVGLRNLPREKWHEIRYLAVKNGESRVPLARSLVAKAVHHADSIHAISGRVRQSRRVHGSLQGKSPHPDTPFSRRLVRPL